MRRKKIRETVYKDNDFEPIVRIRQTRLKYLKTRRKIRKWQRFFARLHFLCKMAIIFLLLWGFIKVMKLPQWYVSPDVLKTYPNPNLEIEGNKIVSNAEILNILRNAKLANKPIYLISTRSIENNLSKLTPVKKVFIRRFAFPAKFRIVIEEKKPLLSIAKTPESPVIAVFNKDASILEGHYLPLDPKYKTYKIITDADFHQWNPKEIQNLNKLVKFIEAYSKENVVYLDIRNADDVYARVGSVNLRLGEMNRDINNRIKKISSVLPQAKRFGKKIKYIDLRWPDSVFIKLDKVLPTPAKSNPVSGAADG